MCTLVLCRREPLGVLAALLYLVLFLSSPFLSSPWCSVQRASPSRVALRSYCSSSCAALAIALAAASCLVNIRMCFSTRPFVAPLLSLACHQRLVLSQCGSSCAVLLAAGRFPSSSLCALLPLFAIIAVGAHTVVLSFGRSVTLR